MSFSSSHPNFPFQRNSSIPKGFNRTVLFSNITQLRSYVPHFYRKEIDFLVKKGLETAQLIQASHHISSNETRKREIGSLVKVSDETGCTDLLILTWDYKREEDAKEKRVTFMPLWMWLLDA